MLGKIKAGIRGSMENMRVHGEHGLRMDRHGRKTRIDFALVKTRIDFALVNDYGLVNAFYKKFKDDI